MSDNILSAVLTLSLMAGGTAAIGSEMLAPHHGARTTTTAMAQVSLPAVTVIGHRELPMAIVTLPTVTVVGHRQAPTALAAETVAADTQARVE